jgi:hypothetical protein
MFSLKQNPFYSVNQKTRAKALRASQLHPAAKTAFLEQPLSAATQEVNRHHRSQDAKEVARL